MLRVNDFRAYVYPEMNRDTQELPAIIADLEKSIAAMQGSQYET